MRITCFIRYEIDPFQRQAFRRYAENWAGIIPRLGGHLVGYFLPHEGSNVEAWGLVAFASLDDYETYRERLKADPEAQSNFELASRERFVLREERRFTEIVEAAFQQPAEDATPTLSALAAPRGGAVGSGPARRRPT